MLRDTHLKDSIKERVTNMHSTIFYSDKLKMYIYESHNGNKVRLYPICQAPGIQLKPALKYRVASSIRKLFRVGV